MGTPAAFSEADVASVSSEVSWTGDYENTWLAFPQAAERMFYDRFAVYAKLPGDEDEEEDNGEESIYSEVGNPMPAAGDKYGKCSMDAPVPSSSTETSPLPPYAPLHDPLPVPQEDEAGGGEGQKGWCRCQCFRRRACILVCSAAVVLAAVSAAAMWLALANRATLDLVERRFAPLEDSRWYHFSENECDYHTAQTECKRLGGEMLEIRTVKDHDVVSRHLSALKLRNWWLGATDSASEGVFRWSSDNASLESSMAWLWSPGQPDNWPDQPGEPEEDCLVYAFGLAGQNLWRWNDLDCQSHANFVCVLRT